MADLNLPSFPTFDYDCDKSNAGPRWEKWVGRLENLFVGLNIDDDGRRRALLLHYGGERVYDIYDVEKKETEATYDATKEVLKNYFKPKVNMQMEVYKFRNCKQAEGQTLDEYATELRRLAKDCEFGADNIDKEILSQIIQNCKSNRLRRRALRETDKTLDDILTLGRTLELADTHATAMEHDREHVVAAVDRPRGKARADGSTRRDRPPKSKSRGGASNHDYHRPKEGDRPKEGATVNILDEKTYQKIGAPVLRKRNSPRLLPYGGGEPLKVLGQCELLTETADKIECHVYFVAKGNNGSLLGYHTASQSGLVKVVHKISDPGNILNQYPELCNGIGKYTKGKVKIHIDENVPPVAQRHRRTPFHLRGKVEEEINKLLESDIIEKVGGSPTPWVSPIVTPPKKDPNEIRLCVDMRQANKAIKRERHILPTVDELIHDLTGAAIFSKLDMRSGYHQLELEPSSRYITTFSTPVGLFQYKRLNFGISSASEIFQETVRGVIQNVSGASNISDDILVFGKNQAEHDKALTDTFQALKENGGCQVTRRDVGPNCGLNSHLSGPLGGSGHPTSKID